MEDFPYQDGKHKILPMEFCIDYDRIGSSMEEAENYPGFKAFQTLKLKNQRLNIGDNPPALSG